MNARDSIKEAMKNKGFTYQMLGEPLGKNIQNMWNLINGKNNNLKVSTMVRLLHAMGYKLVIVDSSMRVKNGIEISEAE